ncbi:MAG: tetratricopeptide repeat protein [Thermodesulfobacteriota bacterium]
MTNNPGLISVQKVAAVFGLFCLGILLASFVFFKFQHPSLTKQVKVSADPMAEMSRLMNRLQEDPENEEVLFMLGQRFMQMRAWDKALEFWNRFLELQPENNIALTQKGFCFFQKEEYSKARDVFNRLLSLDDRDYRAHYNLGMLYKYYLEKPDLAREHFTNVLKFAPPDEDRIRSEVGKELSGKEQPNE